MLKKKIKLIDILTNLKIKQKIEKDIFIIGANNLIGAKKMKFQYAKN